MVKCKLLELAEATLNAKSDRRTPETVVKCKFSGSSRNPFVTSCSSDVQNCGEMQILPSTVQPFRKRIRKAAELLSLDEIAELERLCIEGTPNHIQVIAGHLFFNFMSAARWHDTMYIVDTEFTEHRGVHLIEASTERRKTSRGKEQQMELLPFTALGQATLDVPWSEHWGDARIRAGCLDCYFLRSWSESSATWSPCRMSTAEATCWLRELLEQFGWTGQV